MICRIKYINITSMLLLLISPVEAQSDHRNHYDLTLWNDYAGSYEIENGRYIVIGLASGGRLTYLDIGTGKFGTLTKTSEDKYADGTDEIFRFMRDHEGVIKGVERTEGENEKLIAKALKIRYENIMIESNEAVISGTLILPSGEPSYPAIILNGGASWIVREQVMQDALVYASHGIASFIYDKRGWGESTGNKTVSFEKSAGDIVAIAAYLKNHRTDLNPQQIGISTYSQSGWYGTLAASMTNAIKFLILNVPSATIVYRQEFQRVENELHADGFSSEEIKDALSFMNLMSSFSRSGEGWNEYIKMRETASEQKWFSYIFAPKSADPEVWLWGRLNWEYNPLPALLSITVPVLVLLGEHDKKVLSEVNRSIFETAFDAAGNRDYEIKIIPGMNHSLVTSKQGGRKEETENQIVNELLQGRIKWLKDRF